MIKHIIFLFFFFICIIHCDFEWNPPLAAGLSVQGSSDPNCVGGFDVVLDNMLYSCFGGSIETTTHEESCPNGLKGILLNGTLTCGVITEYLLPGQGGCSNGGYTFLSNTQNFTNCYGDSSYASSVLTTHFYDYLLFPYSQNNTQEYLDALNQLQYNQSVTTTILGGRVNAIEYNINQFNQSLINITSTLLLLINRIAIAENDIETINGTVQANTNAINHINDRFTNSSSFQFYTTPTTVSGKIFYTVTTPNMGGVPLFGLNDGQNLGTYELVGKNAANVFLNNSQITIDVPFFTYSITATNTGSVSPISSNTPTSTTLQSFGNTPSVAFSSDGNTITANAFTSTSDLTSGYASLLGGCIGANCAFRQIQADDSSLIDVIQNPFTVAIKSKLTANNVRYPNASLSIFPDCPFASSIADFLVCISTRTLSSLTNITNARQVQYDPQQPFQGNPNFTVADGFDILFNNQRPVYTGIWNADPNGDDAIADGSPVNPFRTLGALFAHIATFQFDNAQLVYLARGSYYESSLEWPPNTFVTADSLSRVVNVFVNGTITLRSDWAFAGSHVEGGFDNIVFTANLIHLDFTIMGIPSMQSIEKFSIFNSEVISPIVNTGRGKSSLFHFLLSDIDQTTILNCANTHFERNIMNSANIILSDYNCSATFYKWHLIFNYFEDGANLTAMQSTSALISMGTFLNAWDLSNVYIFAVINGSLIFDTFTLPLNVFIQNTVIINYNLNFEASQMCGLDPTYWGASCLGAREMMNVLMSRSKTLATSNAGGATLIKSSSITTNTLVEVLSLSSFLTIRTNVSGILGIDWVSAFVSGNPSLLTGVFVNGTLYVNPVDSVNNILQYSLNCHDHLGVIVCQSIILNVTNVDCDSGLGYNLYIGDGVTYPNCYPNPGNDTIYLYTSSPSITLTLNSKNNYTIGFVDTVTNIVQNTLSCYNHSSVIICQVQVNNVTNTLCNFQLGYNILIGNGVSYPGCYLGYNTSASGTFVITPIANQTTATALSNGYSVGLADPLVAPGSIQDGKGLYLSNNLNVVASGTTQLTATAIGNVSSVYVVTTPASSGIILPIPIKAGMLMTVFNNGANSLNVYPAVGGIIDSAGLNNPVRISSSGTAIYISFNTTQWYVLKGDIVGIGSTSVSNNLGVTSINTPSTVSGTTYVTCAGITSKTWTTIADTSMSPGCGANLNYIIPQNTLTQQSQISVTVIGSITAAAATTANLNFFLNATAVITQTNVALNKPSGWGFRLSYTCTVRSVGVAGSVMCGYEYHSAPNAGGTGQCAFKSGTLTTIDTTQFILMDPHFKFNTAAGSSITVDQVTFNVNIK